MLATQFTRNARVKVNSNANTTASRIMDFTRKYSPTSFNSKVEEDPKGFIDEVFKVPDAMGVSSKEKAEVAFYELKYVVEILYEQLKDERTFIKGRITYRALNKAFLDRLFPVELKERKLQQFINLHQGCMNVK